MNRKRTSSMKPQLVCCSVPSILFDFCFYLLLSEKTIVRETLIYNK